MPRSPDAFETGRELDADDFVGQARDVARDLVGTLLLNEPDASASGETDAAEQHSQRVGGLIVETEAYVNAVDPACHLAGGRTARTESFFSGPGTVYVYVMHGHAALNLISTYHRHPEGILIRAVEPTHGLDAMADRRGIDLRDADGEPDPTAVRNLASGPGKLTQALGITKADYDDRPLADTSLAIYETDWTPEVDTTARIGVTAAEDWPLRFAARQNGFTSKPAPDVDLDWAAVDDAYEALEADADLPTIDTE